MAKLRVTLIRSGISNPYDQKRTLRALGFKRLNQSVSHEDSAALRGMIMKVRHLVKVEVENGEAR